MARVNDEARGDAFGRPVAVPWAAAQITAGRAIGFLAAGVGLMMLLSCIRGQCYPDRVPEYDVLDDDDVLALPQDVGLCPILPNGCGTTGLLGILIPECPLNSACFTLACNRHDVCYAMCGVCRDSCDETFLEDMLALCEDAFPQDEPEWARCNGLARLYADVVRRLGQGPFNTAQIRQCYCRAGKAEASTADEIDYNLSTPTPSTGDRDGDFMPDEWEFRFGLDLDDPNDVSGDPDADGLVNLLEFIHNTDPLLWDTDGDGVDDRTQADAYQNQPSNR